MPKGQIGHSESIWTTSVVKNTGKVAKQPKLAIPNQFRTHLKEILENLQIAKIGHSKSIQTTSVGKVAKLPKLAISNQFGLLW